MGSASRMGHGLAMGGFSSRARQPGGRVSWARRSARRLLAVGVCTAAAVSFAAGLAPGLGWALLVIGLALGVEALVSR